MGAFYFVDPYLTIDTFDFSPHLKSATVTIDRAKLDKTHADSEGWEESMKGLRSGSIAVTFNDDLADDGLDEKIYTMWNADTAHAAAFRASDATIAATNPEYQFNVNVTTFTMGGDVGALAGKTLTWPITAAIVRDVTA